MHSVANSKASIGGLSFRSTSHSNRIDRASRYSVPTIYEWREAVAAGGLISYGTDRLDAFRQNGILVGRILKGEKPSDLPVLRARKFELVINLTTAKALGLTIPSGALAIADKVIE